MRFEDEHYVKVFSRDTPTWLCLSFNARGVWLQLLRKLDKAGMLECGPSGKRGVAAVINGPWEVVEPALAEMEQLEMIEWTGAKGTTLIAPRFEEAQESRKSKAAASREYRQKAKDVARAQGLGFIQPDRAQASTSEHKRGSASTNEEVRHPPSPSPSPSPSPDKHFAGSEKPNPPRAITELQLLPPDGPAPPKPRPKNEKPTDPRLMPLRRAMVELYERVRGEKYPDRGAADTEGVKRCLPLGPDAVVLERFERGLRETHDWRRVDSLADLSLKWARLAVVKPEVQWSRP